MATVSLSNVTPLGGSGGVYAVQADVVMSSSYATGGDTVPIGQLGLKQVNAIVTHGGMLQTTAVSQSGKQTPNTHGLQLVLAGTPGVPLLQAIAGAAGAAAQVAAATNLSTVPAVRVLFYGN